MLKRYDWTYAGGVEGTVVELIASAPCQKYSLPLNGCDVDSLGLMGAVEKYIEQRERWHDTSSLELDKLKYAAELASAKYIKALFLRWKEKSEK
ncbi:hypothetical protein ABXV23_25765 [Vibrio owensii]|uniref:hypothetical protein n=1 Tax=Vibrio owensii TaxID=696485 RepID=UPI003394969E